MRSFAMVFCICSIGLFLPVISYAQLSTGIARFADIKGTAEEGDILTATRNGFELAKSPYDAKVQGVVVDNPAIIFKAASDEGKKYTYIGDGDVLVKVSTINGNISRGDVLATSSIPGTAVKATKSGYVIGTALGTYSSNDPKKIGKIKMTFGVRYVASRSGLGSSLLDIFNLSTLATYEQPLTVFKYVLAGLVAVISLSFGFFYFGRIASMGIEALGRNPLASRMIQIGIFLNVLLTAMIIGGGIFIAILILRL